MRLDMKKFAKLAVPAIAAMSLVALAGTAQSGYICTGSTLKADKTTLAPDLIRSNVPTCDGKFVAGFQIIGSTIEWYVDASKADECFNMDVTVLPEGVSAYEMDEILEYLGDRDLDVFRPTEVLCPA